MPTHENNVSAFTGDTKVIRLIDASKSLGHTVNDKHDLLKTLRRCIDRKIKIYINTIQDLNVWTRKQQPRYARTPCEKCNAIFDKRERIMYEDGATYLGREVFVVPLQGEPPKDKRKRIIVREKHLPQYCTDCIHVTPLSNDLGDQIERGGGTFLLKADDVERVISSNGGSIKCSCFIDERWGMPDIQIASQRDIELDQINECGEEKEIKQRVHKYLTNLPNDRTIEINIDDLWVCENGFDNSFTGKGLEERVKQPMRMNERLGWEDEKYNNLSGRGKMQEEWIHLYAKAHKFNQCDKNTPKEEKISRDDLATFRKEAGKRNFTKDSFDKMRNGLGYITY